MKRYPLKLSYIAKTALWGGNNLSERFNKNSDFDKISETWELSVRDDAQSVILSGEASGKTLREYFDEVGYDAVAPDFKVGDRFPLLIKFIDANDRLSLQVHPDDSYASQVENDSGKTEMWYIVSAKEDSSIIYGLGEGVSEADFADRIRDGKTADAVATIPVKAGESYFIPSGMVHAIGEGIIIAEIQQNSDLTYRVYDYDRVGADGKKRELHVEKAIAVTKGFTQKQIDDICYSKGAKKDGVLADCEYFKVERLCIDGKAKRLVDGESFESILVLEGEGAIIFNGEEYAITQGDSWYLPAGMGEYELVGGFKALSSKI